MLECPPEAQTQLACHSFEAIEWLTCLELAGVCGRSRCSLPGCAFPFASFARDPGSRKGHKNAKDTRRLPVLHLADFVGIDPMDPEPKQLVQGEIVVPGCPHVLDELAVDS